MSRIEELKKHIKDAAEGESDLARLMSASMALMMLDNPTLSFLAPTEPYIRLVAPQLTDDVPTGEKR